MESDSVIRRHKLLLTKISDEFDPNSEEYIKFLEFFKTYVGGRGLLKSKKTLLDKFEALETKGHLKPGKYDVLKTICEDSGNINIKALVEKAETDIKELVKTGTDTVGPSAKRTRIDTAVPSERERTAIDKPDPLYRMDKEEHGYYDNSKKTGMLLILNYIEGREGTEKDLDKLKGFFGDKGLRFQVFDPRQKAVQDLTKEDVEKVLSKVRTLLNSPGGTQYYCFICVIMSHGEENVIKTKNDLFLVEDIRQFFNNKNMPNFAGRPKVFFIQACRGSAQQDAQEIDVPDDEKRQAGQNVIEDESDEIIRIPTDADTLLAYATTLGYKSFRRPSVGSWFITECINVFEKYHERDHLEEMLITVRQEVALRWEKRDGAKQMPCVWSTLTKRLMLTENKKS